jgi:hypothetical protein
MVPVYLYNFLDVFLWGKKRFIADFRGTRL